MNCKGKNCTFTGKYWSLFFCLSASFFFFYSLGSSWAWNPQVLNGRCKQTGQVCYSTIGNAGGRGACCDPTSRNVIQCNQNNPCVGGKPYRWSDSDLPLRWWFNPNNMPGQSGYRGLTESQIESAFKTAWDKWTEPKCTSFRHKYMGKSNAFPSRQDQKVLLFLPTPSQWAQMGAGGMALAFTIPIPDYNGRLRDADIVFNPAPGGRTWKIYPNVGRWDNDLLAVAAHEIGHALGFAHTPYQSSLMYFANKPGPFPGLSKDEVDAVCYTYKKKGPCNSDSDCGGCFACQNSKCVIKGITPLPKLCKPCKNSSDCGQNGTCLYTEDGNRCVQSCDANGCCPQGYRCSEVGLFKVCIPDSGKCPAVKCTSSNECGPGEQCVNGTCKPPAPQPSATSCKSCNRDSDCGKGELCYSFPDGKRRCLQPCVGGNFCPNGYSCISAGSGRYCYPPDGFCPCSSNSNCLSGEICRSGVCRPSECKYLCRCREDKHCSPGYRCFQTGRGGVCLKPCGGNANFPPGSPGGPCLSNGLCNGGATCYRFGSGQTICLTPCRSNPGICRSTGGRCYQMGTQAFCLCRSSRECKVGQACNMSILGRYGAGACASGGSQIQCESGFTCKSINQSLEVCMPKPTQGPGEKCNQKLACKDGLICVLVSRSSSDGICMEDCTKSNRCIFGGTCSVPAGNNSKLCGCSTNSQCRRGQICSRVSSFLSVCKNKGGGGTNSCGNGTCERDKGEDCGTCAKDCKCSNGRVCRNNRCVPAQGNSCGNGTCERDKGEDCGTCAKDCKCSNGRICRNNRCVPAQGSSCGNGTCERDKGEDCGTCAKDCKCSNGRICQNNRCVPVGEKSGQGTDAGENTELCSGDNCEVGEVSGCGCTSGGELPSLFFIFFSLAVLGGRKKFKTFG